VAEDDQQVHVAARNGDTAGERAEQDDLLDLPVTLGQPSEVFRESTPDGLLIEEADPDSAQ
jgi:hypothetical protein